MRTDPLGPASGSSRSAASPLRGAWQSAADPQQRGYGGGAERGGDVGGYESGLGRYLPQQSGVGAYLRGEPGGTPNGGGYGGISAYASVGGTPGGVGFSSRLSRDDLGVAAEASPYRNAAEVSSSAGGRGNGVSGASPSRQAAAGASSAGPASATAHPRTRLEDLDGISADLLRRVGGLRGASSPPGGGGTSRAVGEEGGGLYPRSELRGGGPGGSLGFDARGLSASALSRSLAASPPKALSSRLP